jgi:hypothetical protein
VFWRAFARGRRVPLNDRRKRPKRKLGEGQLHAGLGRPPAAGKTATLLNALSRLSECDEHIGDRHLLPIFFCTMPSIGPEGYSTCGGRWGIEVCLRSCEVMNKRCVHQFVDFEVSFKKSHTNKSDEQRTSEASDWTPLKTSRTAVVGGAKSLK